MMITLDKDDIIEAVNFWLNDNAGQSITAPKKMTWYFEEHPDTPWKLEVEFPKEPQA